MSDKKMQEELSELANARTKALEKLSRRDRAKMQEITEDFHQKRQSILDKYQKKADKDAEEAAIKDAKKKETDARKADEEAAKKQGGAKKSGKK